MDIESSGYDVVVDVWDDLGGKGTWGENPIIVGNERD